MKKYTASYTNSNGQKVECETKICTAEYMKLMKKQVRQAYRDVGKQLVKDVKSKIGGRGYFVKGVTCKVEITKKSGYNPNLILGYKMQSKVKNVPFYINPSWYELGTASHKISAKSGKVLTDGTNIYGVTVYVSAKEHRLLEQVCRSNQNQIMSQIRANLSHISGLDVSEDDVLIEEGEEEID